MNLIYNRCVLLSIGVGHRPALVVFKKQLQLQMSDTRSILHEPLLSQTTEEEGSRSASQSRELTEVGDEARARDHEVREDDLLVTDSAGGTAVEIRGVTPPKEEDDLEELEKVTRQERKRPWKTTNGRGRWFGRKRSDSEEHKGRREPTTWNSGHGTPQERRRQKHTVIRLTPSSPRRESRFEPAQVNDLQLQYDKEGFRITSRTASTDSTAGVIDGRFSSSFSEGYVAVEAMGVDMSTTRALELCTKYVLNPFHIFLKVIGWRPLRSLQRDTQPCIKKIFNVIYPAFIFLMLVFTGCSQTISCFSRTRAHSPTKNCNDTGEFYVLDCREGLVSSLLSTDLLLLVAYLWALYNFRWGEPEHLSTLIQKVFLSCNSNVITLKRSQKRLVFVLLTFLVMGILWVLYSTSVSILRVFALRLNDNNTIIGWFFKNECNSSFQQQDYLTINKDHYDIIHYLFLVLSMLGFMFFDMLYVAVVINYCTQCQLLHYYVSSIKDKVVNKAYLLGDAVKEIYNVREFLLALNGMTAFVTSITLFIFLQGVALSFLDWRALEPGNYLQIALGFLNVLQWSIVTVLPIIQATRLTAECRGLKKLGLEIAARPFYYSDTPQLVLDSFLNYTNATNYKVKLMFIPMYSEIVVGFLFMFLLVFSVVLTAAHSQFQFATWI